MEYKLTIPYTLPSLNNYINEERVHWSKAADLKKDYQNNVVQLCRSQLRGLKITKPVFMKYLWVEETRKRDKDNISSMGRKIIQDALVEAKILPNDNWKYVEGFSDRFVVDKKFPRIEVTIIERERR